MHDLKEELKIRIRKIKLVLTDCDGVLTDGCVYYSARGEEMKKFSFRDGMGVERLRKLRNIDTGIITKENSEIVARRAEKLKIVHYYAGVHNKVEAWNHIVHKTGLTNDEIAYIGDDVNDADVLALAGLSACPADAVNSIKSAVHYTCHNLGGTGAFRELAELIIEAQTQ
jgi:3-deoxy-D-manno-octulosonate 8-phosphate phosphatase (KDO 8-P phosphatase)